MTFYCVKYAFRLGGLLKKKCKFTREILNLITSIPGFHLGSTFYLKLFYFDSRFVNSLGFNLSQLKKFSKHITHFITISTTFGCGGFVHEKLIIGLERTHQRSSPIINFSGEGDNCMILQWYHYNTIFTSCILKIRSTYC